MRYKFILILTLIFGLLVTNGLTNSYAQVRNTGRSIRDPKIVDSFQLKRNQARDSITAIKKYRNSRHYRDSVTKSRIVKAEVLKTGRLARADSLKDVRNNGLKSITEARQSKTDSIKTAQKHRTDSLARIKKYKLSKRYADSTTLAHREHTDSIKNAQTHFRDSVASARKHVLDSAKTVRKHIMDSVKTVRTKTMDSIKLVRKTKADNLAKIAADKEKIAKAKEKKKLDDLKIKLEIKFKKKQEAWSNKSMLKKKWSLWRRIVQNSFTHYNYYFNANKKMDEAMVNMQRSRKENLDSIINLYPFDPNKDSALLAADMDSIIRKASVGLQIHDPRVKWANDLYLLLGQANYYKGKYEIAATAFRFIIAKDEAAKKKDAIKNKHYGVISKDEPTIVEDNDKKGLSFFKHKSVHNESILWLSRTYTSWHMVENAESVVSLLESDTHLPDNLKGRLAAEKAFAYLTEHNNQAAITQLSIVADDNYLPDWLKMRAAFLNGQLLQSRGEYAAAVTSFENVLDYYPKLEMDFYTRKNIAYNSLLAGNDASVAMKPLKRVLKDAKYVTYYDQVYYVLGKLAIKAGKTKDGINYLNKSIYTPKATKKQKALSFATIGDAYYTDGKYKYAKSAYDSAAKYAGTGTKDTMNLATIKRSKLLSEIVIPTTIIHDEDSLLALSLLSKKEQMTAVRKWLRMMEKNKQDSITNAETASAPTITLPDAGSESSDYANWYFSNPTQMQQGSAEFKRKWGNRTLTDNWRRAANNAFSANNNTNDELKETDDDNETLANGLPTEASLFAKIPNKPEQKEQAIKLEQRAYIQLAKAYFFKFDDTTQAINTLDNLDNKFTDHNQKEEELYLRYQIAIRQNQLAKAQTYSEQLLKQFPKSEYAKLLRPKDSYASEAQSNGITVTKYYEETYNLLLKHQYSEALLHIDIAKKQYDNPIFKKRFLVAEAMAMAGMGNLDKADSSVANFLHTYPPPDTLAAWANAIRNYIASIRKTGLPAWYKESPPGERKAELAKTDEIDSEKPVDKPIDTTVKPTPKPEIPAMYQNHPKDEHYCIVILPGLDAKIIQLKKKIKTFDSSKYSDNHLEIILDYFDIDQTVLVIKKFIDADACGKYLAAIKETDIFNNFDSKACLPVLISAQNYSKLIADKKIQSYLSFYYAVYK